MKKVDAVLKLIEKLKSSEMPIDLSQAEYQALQDLKTMTRADFSSEKVYENICKEFLVLRLKETYLNESPVHIFEFLPIINNGETVYQIIMDKLKNETTNYKIIGMLNLIPAQAISAHIEELRPIIMRSIHNSNGVSSKILENEAVKNDKTLAKIISYLDGKNRIANFYDIIKNIDDLSNIESEIKSAMAKYYDEKIKRAREKNNLIGMKRAIIDRFFDLSDYGRYRKIENFASMAEEEPAFLTPELKQVYDLITNILYSTDQNQLMAIYQGLAKQNIEYASLLNGAIDKEKEHIKKQFASALKKTYTPKEKIDGVPIIDITDENFLLLIHNTQASVTTRKSIDEPAQFEKQNINLDTISCSAISNFMLAIANPRHKHLIYGFKDINDSDIYTMADKDAQIDWTARNGKTPFAENEFWHTPEQLPLSTRFGYNEVDIWRETKGKNKRPDYILAFDQISEEEIRHAQYYNIPIYYVDKKKLYNKNIAALLKEISDMKNKPSPTLAEIDAFYKKFASTVGSLMREDFDYKDFISQEDITACYATTKSLIETNQSENPLLCAHIMETLKTDYEQLGRELEKKNQESSETSN